MAVTVNGRKKKELAADETIGISLSIVPAFLAVFCAAVICFANSYDGEFVFDDTEAIEGNRDLLPSTSVFSLLEHDFWGKKLSNHSHKSYRPLTVLTFRWSYWLAGGLYPEGFHVANILLHGLVCALTLPVFHLALSPRCSPLLAPTGNDGKDRQQVFWPPRVSVPAFLCSLLFAVHPVHTESVAAIVGRADLLCALFFILSFLCYVKACYLDVPDSGNRILWVALSMLFCCLATFSKEQGITVIGVCSAFDILYVCEVDIGSLLGLKQADDDSPLKSLLKQSNGTSPKQQPRETWQKSLIVRHLVLLVSGVFLLSVRWQVMGSSPPTFQVVDNPHSFVNGSLYRALNYNYLYSINSWLLLCPAWLCFDWSMGCVPTIDTLSDPRLLAVLALWTGVACLAWACLCFGDSHSRRKLTLSVAFIVIPFLPASNLLFRVGFVVAERVLYLPSAGFCLLVTIGLQRVAGSKQARSVGFAAFGVLLTVFVMRSIQRSSEWRKGLLLFKSAEKICPLNAKVHYNIAKLTHETDPRAVNEVTARYRHAIELNPKYDQAMNNLANLLKDEGQEEEAERLLDTAVSISPEFAAAWMNRGIVKASLRKYEEAEYSYRQGIRFRRNYPDCYYNLGNMYVDMNRSQNALDAFHNATHLKPTHWNAWNNGIILLDNLGYYEKASQMGEAALKLLPDNPHILFSVANVLGKAERWQDSEEKFLRAIRVTPNNPSLHLNLGVLYHRWGKLTQAEQAYKTALQIDPSSRVAAENYNMLKGKMKSS